jgi:arylsulfatase A-like enzyme
MKSLPIFFASVCLFSNPLVAAETAGAKPNIIYLLSDDMGYSDVGFNGCKDILTPNLDKLAQQGAVLECLYGQPVCSPTRAALLSGRYPTHTGVYNVVSAKDAQAWPLPLAERTLAQALHEVGYTTAICGKWHLGEAKPEFMPTRRGFDHQFGFMGGTINSFTHAGGAGSDPSKPTDWYRDDIASEGTGYSTHLITQEACRLIREQPADKPLFLYVAPNAVHTPWLSPDENKKSYAHLSKRRMELAGMASALDEGIGKIIAALTEKGMMNNTLIIYSTDNGGPSWDDVATNGSLRGGKSDIYEGGFRIGAFAVWPGKIPAGIRIKDPLHVVDWFPTLAKLAGASVTQPLPLDGSDIWPVLSQGAKSPHEEILLVGSRAGQSAIRMGDWKLLVNPMEFKREVQCSPVELYNLSEDIGEKTNLAAAQPERVKKMRARLDALLASPANPDYLQTKTRKGKKATSPE